MEDMSVLGAFEAVPRWITVYKGITARGKVTGSRGGYWLIDHWWTPVKAGPPQAPSRLPGRWPSLPVGGPGGRAGTTQGRDRDSMSGGRGGRDTYTFEFLKIKR